jgi:hypothetical protein
MAEKVHVTAWVDPEQETVIKPFAAQLASPQTLKLEGGLKPETTATGTVTYNNGQTDADATVDYP